MNQEIIIKSLESKEFARRKSVGINFEKYSGGGIGKKIARLLLAPQIYIPYLAVVKMGLFKKESARATLFWGRKINLPIHDFDSLALRAFGFAGGTDAELKLVKYIAKNLAKNDVFYDIGGNYGFFTYLASEIVEETHTFEPIPLLANTIKNNVQENGNVKVNNMALGETSGKTSLYMSESSGLSTINKNTTTIHTYSFDESKTLEVKVETLDEYTQRQTPPTFIKIDVEGAEEAVIKGGQNFLKNNNPIIAMEVWGSKNGGDISMRAVNLLLSLGYTAFAIESDGSLREAHTNVSHLAPENGGDNFIFKKI